MGCMHHLADANSPDLWPSRTYCSGSEPDDPLGALLADLTSANLALLSAFIQSIMVAFSDRKTNTTLSCFDVNTLDRLTGAALMTPYFAFSCFVARASNPSTS